MSELIMQVKNITKNFPASNNRFLTACDDVSLNINAGETVGIVGESGCGKSTLVKTIMNMHVPTSGEVIFQDQDITKLTGEKRRQNCRHIQMVFQDPTAAFNPKMKIGDILREPLDINTNYSKSRKNALVKEVLNDVGLQQTSLELYPHEFSGGQRQRIAIARALILNPKLIIADEPVSALDASIQAQIINLLKDLKKQKDLTILFISHDLNVIRYLADRVGIMYFGRLIEENTTDKIFNFPEQEYTKILLESAPTLAY